MLKLLGTLIFVSISFAACSQSSKTTAATATPDAFCETPVTYSSGVAITGSAVYEYRTNGSGAVNVSPKPIRMAEVIVFNADDEIIQCGTTDMSGIFSVSVPNPSTNLNIKVTSRISNALTKAYVLDKPDTMDYHSIETGAFSVSAAGTVGTLTAPATGTLEGGAFNILDKILDANIYLETNTANCSVTFTTCTPFTGGAPLLKVFWSKGVNPGTYVSSSGAVSFYLPGEYELYILGGVSGNVDSADCDHFDNSIIVHEYGHFIEDVFSKTNSPGGQHDGDSIIDPRLAWGEAWADFFQAAVNNLPVYRDTVGNISGSAALAFNQDLENQEDDIPTSTGEGIFHEFSITRVLWDAIDDNTLPGADSDTVQSPFSELWTVFTNSVNGFKYAGYHFRNAGLFHYIQSNLAGAQNWATIRSAEYQNADETFYSRAVATSVGACSPTTTTIAPASAPGVTENGTASHSNQYASNDFYKIYHSGGVFTMGMSYTSNSVPSADLDIYIYPENYTFGGTESVKATTSVSYLTLSGTESISRSLAAGYYMINIRANTLYRVGTSTTYSMTLNGVNLCPN